MSCWLTTVMVLWYCTITMEILNNWENIRRMLTDRELCAKLPIGQKAKINKHVIKLNN